MFKEIGDRLKNGTINLVITQKDGVMSVIVAFKNVPGLNEALFRGTPGEIEESFIEKLEQPMELISKFNFDMEAFTKKLEEETIKKTAKKDEAEKKKADKAIADKTQTKIGDLVKSVAEKAKDSKSEKDELDIDDLSMDLTPTEDPTVEKKSIRMSAKHKEEVIAAALKDEISIDNGAILKIIALKDVDFDTAKDYYEANLKADVDKALEDEQHAGNVNAMKKEMNAPETDADDFDPFADAGVDLSTDDEEDEFQL
jgi:hypothetical protein